MLCTLGIRGGGGAFYLVCLQSITFQIFEIFILPKLSNNY